MGGRGSGSGSGASGASGSGAGGSAGGSGGGGGSSSGASGSAAGGSSSGATDWVRVINEARQKAGGDKGWGATYDYLRNQMGYDFAPRGSAADQAFHQVFGA